MLCFAAFNVAYRNIDFFQNIVEELIHVLRKILSIIRGIWQFSVHKLTMNTKSFLRVFYENLLERMEKYSI